MVNGVENKKLDLAIWFLVAAVVLLGVAGNHYFYSSFLLIRVIALLSLAGFSLFLASKTRLGKIASKYVSEAVVELRKVVWPTKKETMQATLSVVVMVLIMGVIIWLLDAVLVSIIGKVIRPAG